MVSNLTHRRHWILAKLLWVNRVVSLIQFSEAKECKQLKINRATLIGSNKDDFHLDTSKLPITILQKGRAELPVTCHPSAGGLRTAKLVLSTNAPNALNFSYELTCIGDAAVAIFKPAESAQIAIEKVRVNSRKSYKIGVRNATTATTALKLYDYQLISSQNANLFKLITQPALIEIGGSGNIEVACDAQDATPGNYSAILRLATNDPTKLVIEYSFTCSIEQSKPVVTLTPAKGSAIKFDRVQKGAKNKIKIIALENATSASGELTLGNPNFSGDGAAAFSIVSIPIKIGIGLKDEIKVQCNAEQSGSYTAILTLATDDPTQPTLDYPVSCEVSDTVAPLYDSQPAPNDSAIMNLGDVVLGASSEPTTIMVKEVGNDTLRVQLDTEALTGDNAKDFKVISPTFPFDIADDGAAIPVTVTCQPSAMGLRTATLNLLATDIHGKVVENFPHPQYRLQCTGYLPIYNSVNYPVEGDIDLGINSIGQSASQNLNIKNTGNGDLTVDHDTVLLSGDDAESFVIKNLPLNIEVGKTKSLGIQCAPTRIGDLQAQLQLISNDPKLSHPKYKLKCTGQEAVGAAYFSKPAPSSTITLDATMGSMATMSLIVREVGTAVLDVGLGTPLLDGDNAEDFNLDISTSSPFTAGKSHFYIPDGSPERTLQITCKPTGEGQRTATLHLTSNDVSKPGYSLQFSM
ncbi:MAG: choice-of-anchor D domain-containing protein [Thiotrichaceae bacterium]